MSLDRIKSSESVDHLLIKKYFCDNIPLSNQIEHIDLEVKIGKRFADVYIELLGQKKIAIEIQHSKISTKEIITRTKEYNEREVSVIWILDGKGPYDRRPQNEDFVFISKSELQLHSMYKGRVYFLNASNEGIETNIYAVHFCPYIEKLKSTSGIFYYKRSKIKKSSIYCELPSFYLILFRNKGFKLAQFTDNSIKDTCISDVIEFLDNYSTFQNYHPEEAHDKCPDGLTLEILVKKFRKKYGLYLLFDVLRYLKFLRMQDAAYLFEPELRHRKCILP
jgi:hypothetical protein